VAVSLFKDGAGNQIGAIQWDGTDAVHHEIHAWTAGAAHVDQKNIMGIIDESAGMTRKHVSVGDWICQDKDRHVFALTNSQMTASYVLATP
jgi:hypothetical protein